MRRDKYTTALAALLLFIAVLWGTFAGVCQGFVTLYLEKSDGHGLAWPHPFGAGH